MGISSRGVRAGRADGSGLRHLAWASVGLIALCVAFAVVDLRTERRRAIESGDAAMGELARVAEALREADEARIHALLARLRVELRSSGSWTELEPAGEGRSAAATAAARQRDTLLRRAIEGSDDVRSIELVVAGPKGLVSSAVGSEGTPIAESAEDSVGEGEARARTRWYSAVVQEAVEANGRRVARGSLVRAAGAGGDEAAVEVVLAVHEAEDLSQGVLIATIELAPFAKRLGSLSSASTRFALVLPDGTPIAPSAHAPRGSIAGLLAEGRLEEAAGETIVEGVGVRTLLRPVPSREGGPVELLFWLERDVPSAWLAAALRSPWMPALLALGLLTIVLFAWDRDRLRKSSIPAAPARAGLAMPGPSAKPAVASARTIESIESAPGDGADAGAAADAESDSTPQVRNERFVLREWLSDVRGCLEREAATRGLTLDLRCERTLPREIEQDPLWLGGLLVSLGREALDATSSSRVALEVTGEGDDRLRFELDAGDTDLASAAGMRVIAGRLGATLEGRGRGRIAVVVPSARAA